MSISMLDIFSEIKSDKMIEKPIIANIIEQAFRNEIIKKFGSDENFDFILNAKNGDFEIWKTKEIVSDEEFNGEEFKIPISEVKKIEDDFEIGEEYSEEFKFTELGRRSILSIKQNLKSKFKEYNDNKVVEKFKDMIGYLYSAEVRYVKRNVVILIDDDGHEIFLPKSNQINGEFYKKGLRVTGVIYSSEIINGKPNITMSRSSDLFLKSLLEDEISEISDGLVTIEKVSRIPGVKSKVIVHTYDHRIDPVGICVGINGSRINSIVRELSGENIDIINKTDNIELLINRCLKPAKITSIDLLNDEVNVYLNGDQMSKAFGKYGSNIKLTSNIIDKEINLINVDLDESDLDIPLTEFNDEIEDWVISIFINLGIDTAKSLLDYNLEYLEEKTDLEKETIENFIKIIKEELKNG